MSRLLSFRKNVARAVQAAAVVDLASDEEEARYKPIEWPLMRRLFGLLGPYKWHYVLGISLGMVMTVLEMMGPQFMRWLVDVTTGFAGHREAYAAGMRWQAIWFVVLAVVTWACALGIAITLQRLTILIMTNAGERVQFTLRRQIFRQLQRMSMSFYDKTKLGRIISRCTSDVNALREVNVWGIDIIVKNGLMIAVSGTMLLITDWRLFLSVAWLAPILMVCNHIYRQKISLAWQIVREGFTRVSTNLAENITGVRVVTAFNRQGPNLATFDRLQDDNTANNIWTSRINGMYQPLLQFVGFVGKVIILAYGGYLVAAGRIRSVGSVAAAFLYWDWFMNPILNFGNFHNQLMMAMAGAERLFNLLDMSPDVHDLPEARALPRIVGHVEFEKVTFGYNPERPVLHEISFEARPGQMVALVGHTGSGKSSIISLIARFYQPQQGRVLVDGHDIKHVIGQTLSRQTGLVLQVNYLFTGTVMDNIRYAKAHASDAEVVAAARAIGSYDLIMALKDGFNTEVGERGANMSLGQRQLICFTRAFLADPRIFMLDEATSARGHGDRTDGAAVAGEIAGGSDDVRGGASVKYDSARGPDSGDRSGADCRAGEPCRACEAWGQVCGVV